MLDAESKSTEAIEGVPDEEGHIDEVVDADLLSRMEDMAIGGGRAGSSKTVRD